LSMAPGTSDGLAATGRRQPKRLLLLSALLCFTIAGGALALGVYIAVDVLSEYGASVGWISIGMQSLALIAPLVLVIALPATWLGLVLWRKASR
jgi:hypothetical protein